MFNQIQEFKSKMVEAGLTPPRDIVDDGNIHRFSTNNKSGDKAGWYLFNHNPIASGCFGDWRTGHFDHWCSKSSKEMSIAEWQQHKANLIKAKQQREEAQQQLHQEASIRANENYQKASCPEEHPYLISKRVRAYCAKQLGSRLVIPITNFEGEIRSLQFIDEKGNKKLLYGGAKKGNFVPITKLETPTYIMICEGFATGTTLAVTFPDRDVIAAIDANNLKAVAVLARKQWPDAQIMIFADDDCQTPGNPGLTKAREAALAAGIQYASPNWPSDAPKELTDFNDLSNWIAGQRMEGKYA